MFSIQFYNPSPRQKILLPHPQSFNSGSFILPTTPQQACQHSPKFFNQQPRRNQSPIHQLSQKVQELQEKLLTVCNKMQKFETCRTSNKLQKVKSPSVLIKPLRDSNKIKMKEQIDTLIYLQSRPPSYDPNQTEELKFIESRIRIYTKRKDFLEKSVLKQCVRLETAPTEIDSSMISITRMKTDAQFSCTYNENGEIIYEGEVKDGLYHGKGHLINTLYRKSNVSVLDCLQHLLLSHECDFWTSYDGQFKDGLFNGPGSLYMQYILKINGNFENGVAEGRITIIDIQKSRVLLIGSCSKGFLEKVYVSNVIKGKD